MKEIIRNNTTESDRLLAEAKIIAHQNHSTDTGEYTKHRIIKEDFPDLFEQIRIKADCEADQVDAVLFSCPIGAKPHVDKLNLKDFGSKTFLYPVIVPEKGALFCIKDGKNTLEANLIVGHTITFEHTSLHWLEPHSHDGCVVVMFAIKNI